MCTCMWRKEQCYSPDMLTLTPRSNVYLYVEEGAVLLASTSYLDYPEDTSLWAVVYAQVRSQFWFLLCLSWGHWMHKLFLFFLEYLAHPYDLYLWAVVFTQVRSQLWFLLSVMHIVNIDGIDFLIMFLKEQPSGSLKRVAHDIQFVKCS